MRKLILLVFMLLLNTTVYAQNYIKINVAAGATAHIYNVKIFYPEGDVCDEVGVTNHLIQEKELDWSAGPTVFELPLNNPGTVCFAASWAILSPFTYGSKVYSKLLHVENIVSSSTGEINAFWYNNGYSGYVLSFANELVGNAIVNNAGNKTYAVTFFLPGHEGKSCHESMGPPATSEFKVSAGSAMQVRLPRLPADDDQFELVCLRVQAGALNYSHGPFAITPTSNAFTIVDHRTVTQNPNQN